jgi:hypothetical protein
LNAIKKIYNELQGVRELRTFFLPLWQTVIAFECVNCKFPELRFWQLLKGAELIQRQRGTVS